MRCSVVLPASTWDHFLEVDRVELDFDQRFRRRILLSTTNGKELLLDLPNAVRLRDGDGLSLEAGGVVRVCASDEPLLEIRAEDPPALARIAWHLGNRHLPVQFAGPILRIRDDHVISGMVKGLGGDIHPVQAPFDPEPGAYAAIVPHHDHGAHTHEH